MGRYWSRMAALKHADTHTGQWELLILRLMVNNYIVKGQPPAWRETRWLTAAALCTEAYFYMNITPYDNVIEYLKF